MCHDHYGGATDVSAAITAKSLTGPVDTNVANFEINSNHFKLRDNAVAAVDGRGNLPKEFTKGKVQSVDATSGIVSVIKEDGSLWSTDLRTAGNFDTFTKLLDDVRSVEAESKDIHLAVRNDNTLWGWGTDVAHTCFPIDVHSLPSDSIDKDQWNTTVTKPIKMMEDVQKVQSSGSVTLFLKTDGSLWTMGSNFLGGLGNGDSLDARAVVPVQIMSGVKDISADGSTCFAIKADGSLWTWGRMPWIELGKTDDIRILPEKIAENVKAVDECGKSIIYVTNDGQMWSLGDDARNSGGRNDRKSDETHDAPFKSTLTNVQSLGCSAYASRGLAIKTDGSLWAWGEAGVKEHDINTPPPFYDLYNHSEYGDNLYDFLQIAGNSASAVPETTPTATASATPTSATVLVNGRQIAFDAYEIGGNNFLKLRDIAAALNGSEKQFEVAWDGSVNAITLTPTLPYTMVGGEMTQGSTKQQIAKLSTDKVYMNGAAVSLTAYTIADNNYFKLRDLGKLFDFGVEWNGTKQCVNINTSKSYTEEGAVITPIEPEQEPTGPSAWQPSADRPWEVYPTHPDTSKPPFDIDLPDVLPPDGELSYGYQAYLESTGEELVTYTLQFKTFNEITKEPMGNIEVQVWGRAYTDIGNVFVLKTQSDANGRGSFMISMPKSLYEKTMAGEPQFAMTGKGIMHNKPDATVNGINYCMHTDRLYNDYLEATNIPIPFPLDASAHLN